ncbi:cupin domain-containing protein [Dechloromonas sp.]|uniref:cupin domain-containing protein n=1 Tax=Dechloromonas sp. TaxID=1917218 RepID=UPI00120B8F54|nr:cupin domain-containing protein [Dechloromonas sp.]MBU3698021.1 cupin domain-containing protein [Dechloromonas sp.]TEX49535.1 MAG: hypothetical protein CFR70_02225 [Rhodocyclaceae bacterium]
MSDRSRRSEVAAYITKDGSEIRELLHPSTHAVRNQSLAEAVIPPGTTTLLHRHRQSEEIYHVTQGHGVMTLNDTQFIIEAGDSILIAPGTADCVCNDGDAPMHILCCCAPAYAHEDTELLYAG